MCNVLVTIQPAFIKGKTLFPFLYYALVLWFSGQVGKTALWKIKNGSYFADHMLIRTLVGLSPW